MFLISCNIGSINLVWIKNLRNFILYTLFTNHSAISAPSDLHSHCLAKFYFVAVVLVVVVVVVHFD